MSIERLTERQKQCLRLVLSHGESKAIARELGISHNVVNKHIEEAMRRLDVSTRAQAAALLARHEGGEDSPPQPEPLQTADFTVQEPIRDDHFRSPPGVSASGVLREEQAAFVPLALADFSRLDRLFTGGIRPNDLSTRQRIVTVLVLAILLAVAFGLFFEGVEALSRFGRSLASR